MSPPEKEFTLRSGPSLVRVSANQGDGITNAGVISLIHISGIRADGRNFRQEFGDLRHDVNTAIETIRREAREDRAQIAGGLKLLTGKVVEIDNRLTRIEERIGPPG